LEVAIINKLKLLGHTLSEYCTTSSTPVHEPIYYSRKTGYFLVFSDFIPEVHNSNNESRLPAEFKHIICYDENHTKSLTAILNSSLFFWFSIICSDARHINKREIDSFTVNLEKLVTTGHAKQLVVLNQKLMQSYKDNSAKESLSGLTIQVIYPRKSKSVIDQIDSVLAMHYNFTDEELDFIINYDIKYRMGGADDEK
jgi:hypothetical protein